MRIIRIGKEGDQPFKVTAEGVSRHHATLTIDDYDRWFLADNDSANGTYVRNETSGNLMRVGTQGISISEMTFIVLAADNALGCSFYAKQLVKPGDFVEEHFYMQNKNLAFNEEEEKVARRAKWVRISIFLIMLLFTIGTVIWQMNSSKTDTTSMFTIYRCLSCLTMLGTAFYDAQGRRAKIMKRRNKFSHCPNPECDFRLPPDAIENLRCPKCGK